MLVLDTCLEKTGCEDTDEAFSATVRLKGQVYYGRERILTHGKTAEKSIFHLFCEGNEKPFISGTIHHTAG